MKPFKFILTLAVLITACSEDPVDVEQTAFSEDTGESGHADEFRECSPGICCGTERTTNGYTTWGDCQSSTIDACDGHFLDCGNSCYNGGDWCAVPPGNGYNTCCG